MLASVPTGQSSCWFYNGRSERASLQRVTREVRLGGLGYVLGEALYGYAGFDAPERGDSVDAYLKVFVLIVV